MPPNSGVNMSSSREVLADFISTSPGEDTHLRCMFVKLEMRFKELKRKWNQPPNQQWNDSNLLSFTEQSVDS